MVPHYQSRHARQNVGLEGPDLAGQRRRELLSSARDISIDSILQFDLTQFHVASQSRPGSYYAIDLDRVTCDCMNFPKARFCKHIAAIYVHFPHLAPDDNGSRCSTIPSEATQNPVQPHTTRPEGSLLQTLSNDVAVLSQALTSGQADASAAVEAFRSAKYSMAAAIAKGTSALPEKERIAPNQKSWPETAERMGVERAPKRKRLPEERGITEKSIGIAKGKRRRIHQDPYAGGERSGKNAKPDALSAMANVRACTNAAPSPIVPFPPSQVPQRRAPSSSLTSSPVTHVPTSLPT
jgi:hypothetical protein